ncbi:MAG: helix-turn-helix domain-containing protein [bacterium JZ-2024 1]
MREKGNYFNYHLFRELAKRRFPRGKGRLLALRLGVSQTTLSKLLNGKLVPSLRVVKLISRELGVSCDRLIYITPPNERHWLKKRDLN